MGWRRRVAVVTSLLTGALLVAAAVMIPIAPRPLALAHLSLGVAVAPAAAVLGVVIGAGSPATSSVASCRWSV